MNSMVIKSFDNLAQRSLYYFISTYAPFVSTNSDMATVEEQESAYHFIKSIYENTFKDPSLLKLKTLPDDSFSDWEYHKTNPKLVTDIREGIKKVEQFINLIYQISLSKQINENTFSVSKNDLEIKPAVLKQLQNFNIKYQVNEKEYIIDFPIKVSGLKLLATISKQSISNEEENQKPYVLFSRGVFNVNHPWTYEVFRNFFEDQRAFDRLISFLDKNNYKRVDGSECIALNYVKNYSKKQEKLKAAWAERTHGGIELIYEETRKNQPLLSLRIPYYKEILEHSSKMSNKLKNFIINYTKKCDNCRYCVQTDKSGTRPLAFINVDDNNLCPLFCGFSYRWKAINDDIVDNIIELLQFIDEAFRERCA